MRFGMRMRRAGSRDPGCGCQRREPEAVNPPHPPADLGAAGKKLWRQIMRDAARQGVATTSVLRRALTVNTKSETPLCHDGLASSTCQLAANGADLGELVGSARLG